MNPRLRALADVTALVSVLVAILVMVCAPATDVGTRGSFPCSYRGSPPIDEPVDKV